MRVIGLLLFAACSALSAKPTDFNVTIQPLPNEDFVSCHYSLALPDPGNEVRAVWVIFDRGRDVHDLYRDPKVIAFARRFHIALLLHGHCPGTRPEDHQDMDMEPDKGLGPALLRALDRLAQQTHHAELHVARLVFLGFSGAGALSARLVEFVPDRTIAAILSAPGHYDPVGIDTVQLDHRALAVPELIIAGGNDTVSGTARPSEYFRKYRRQLAPWAFVIQNNSPHCCTANARDLILHWLGEVINQRCPPGPNIPLRPVDQQAGWLTSLDVQETNIQDSFHLRTFNASRTWIKPVKDTSDEQQQNAGWVPDRVTARMWMNFVAQQEHPILPLN